MECAPRFAGCGTQHPHRALGGTRVLLAAAPTTPPCFRHWRRSSSLLSIFSGKNILNFAFVALCGALQTHFHRRGRRGKRHLQRRFLRKRGAGGGRSLPLGGAVAQRLRGYGWRSEKSVKAIAPTGAALAFLCFDFFFRIVKGEQPLARCGVGGVQR